MYASSPMSMYVPRDPQSRRPLAMIVHGWRVVTHPVDMLPRGSMAGRGGAGGGWGKQAKTAGRHVLQLALLPMQSS